MAVFPSGPGHNRAQRISRRDLAESGGNPRTNPGLTRDVSVGGTTEDHGFGRDFGRGFDQLLQPPKVAVVGGLHGTSSSAGHAPEGEFREQGLGEGVGDEVAYPRRVLTPEAILARLSLPVYQFKERILQAVADHQIVLITAQTGSGKTTGVTEILVDAGYLVTATQPRRLAASSAARYMAEVRGERLGETVGFCHAHDRVEGPNTRLRLVTDGYELVKSLFDPTHTHNVLILDELHEWNIHQETLLAWALKEQKEGRPFKLVIMSATIDAERLSRYLGGAPIIDIPGRLFPIEDREPLEELAGDCAALVGEGRNTLIFVPGKREIETTIAALEDAGIDAVIFPLHGQLPPQDQDLVFQHYNKPKIIVTTNVAQTSLTVDDIDAVIDTGLERRMEVLDGVETLDVHLISLADSIQRRGRAGRTKPGIYIWRGEVPRSALAPYPSPEIQRLLLAQTDLRLGCAGINMEEVDFFHQPPRDLVRDGRRTQKALGLRSPSGIITPMGRAITALPVDPHTAVMLIHASLFDDDIPGLLRNMVSMAAIAESQGITSQGSNGWRRFCPKESDSDLFAQLAVFRAAHGLTESELKHNGIKPAAFTRAREIERLVLRKLKMDPVDAADFEFNDEQRKHALECIWAGMVDQLHRRVTDGYSDGDQVRRLSRDSVVGDRTWVVGRPINIGVGGDLTTDTKLVPLLTFATAIDRRWFDRHAPEWVLQRSSRVLRMAHEAPSPTRKDDQNGSRHPAPRKLAQPFRSAGGTR